MNISLPVWQRGNLVDDKGMIQPQFDTTFSQLFTQLQNTFNSNGFVVPEQKTANLQNIPNNLVLDTTTNQLKININGVYRVIQVI